MGSYTAFNDDHRDNVTIPTHKRQIQSIKSSVGDDEYYQQMMTPSASKAT